MVISVVAVTGSTNADLTDALVRGEKVPEGHWLVADRQTAGRGRLGRTWCDGAGNFMGSTVVYPRPEDPPAHTLALVAGLAVQAAVAPHVGGERAVLLKWPNDLLVGHAKLAGILLERTGNTVVVGVGVNLVAAPVVEGRETVALAALGVAPQRDTFAIDLAVRFAAEVARWRAEGLPSLVARWMAVAHPPGISLLVGEPGQAALAGQFGGLDAQGALILTLPDGTTRTVNAGEVRLAPDT